ncbi:3-hexulose-6-phosphate synthase [Neobacillus sp. PS3-40]|uniref:3-hexulose-6-phosphate synthase n=1 Tax=Neobacillus sp. PS3-40 TaxID=3070679 RepID=UPI0027E0214F|nr:3-hexulose-6-phosphate synthase [Neobacillus sp. PS3-40]WML43156.1 3-hexulose-6-phosphate synthase [Neobacillus sp. PS3-40]
MKIQLALDRMAIKEAISITKLVQDSVDWIEVGTSLIKEFGKNSISEIKRSFPNKMVVADIKTIDNAIYEFEMCFNAGADVATVMGVSPIVTIQACLQVAEKWNKKVMIDLLNTSDDQLATLSQFKSAIFCHHVSKDQQELDSSEKSGVRVFTDATPTIAVAGGITLQSIRDLASIRPSVIIIGSAITKANNPTQAAYEFKKTIIELEGQVNE